MPQIEPLEPRRLFAVASFGLNLPATVTVGDTFTATVTAQEHHPFSRGLRSAGALLQWDAALLSIAEARVTRSLPMYQTATTGSGRVDMGGFVLLSAGGRSIGGHGADVFATVQLTAREVGETVIALGPGGQKTITVPTAIIPPDSIDYGSGTVIVLPRSEADLCP